MISPCQVVYLHESKDTSLAGDHVCGSCTGNTNELIALSSVVSRKFTAWDEVQSEDICPSCAWAYKNAPLRKRNMLIHSSEKQVDFEINRSILMQPFSLDLSACIQFTGRKHLLPTAQWGHVSMETGSRRWDSFLSEYFRDVDVVMRTGINVPGLMTHSSPPIANVMNESEVFWQSWLRILKLRENDSRTLLTLARVWTTCGPS